MGCLLLLLCFSTMLHASSALSSNGVTLLSFLRHWTIVPGDINSTWKAFDSTSWSWAEVQCNHANNVVSLNLSEYSISGHLGPEIGHLSHLQTIGLLGANFSGEIPLKLGNCSMLEYLELSQTSFNGGIPGRFRGLEKLKFMNLCCNRLTGDIL